MAKVLYRFEVRSRGQSIIALVPVLVLWYVFAGHGLFHGPRSLLIVWIPLSAGFALLASYLVYLIVIGGWYRLEITDEGVYWEEPPSRKRFITDEQVESFKVLRSKYGGEGSPPGTFQITLKTGEKVNIPGNCIGDEREIEAVLLGKWRHHGPIF